MVSLSLDNPLVRSYIVYSAVLAVKMIALSTLTALTRMSRGVFANPEDAKTLKGGKVKFDDQAVERVRRAHLNDIENIVPFWLLGALYLTTNPVAAWATLLFRVFTGARIVHTLVYCVVPLPQPARALAFGVPYFILFYFGVQTILYHATAL